MHVVLLVRLLGYLKFISKRAFKITVSVISQYVILLFFEICHTSKYREVILLSFPSILKFGLMLLNLSPVSTVW